MSSELIPTHPLRNARVFRRLTREDLQALAQHHVSYNRALVLTDRIDALLAPGVLALLADESIHLFGFEVIASGDVPDAPFATVSDSIGIMVFWVTPDDAAAAANPHIYAVALQGADGPVALEPAIGTGPTRGGIFVAHFDGEESEVTPESWCERLSATAVDTVDPSDGPIAGEQAAFKLSDDPFLWAPEGVWYVFGGDLTLQGDPDRLTGRYRNVRYRHLEWLLGVLALKSDPGDGASKPPSHRFFSTGLRRVPMWAPGPGLDVDGEFHIEGGAAVDIAVPDRYGGDPLWFDIADREADIKQLQADLWGLGFWFPEMVLPAHRPNYSHDPGQQRELQPAHATGTFGAQTVWAVREFQIYAGMARVAHHTGGDADRYVDNLVGTENDDPYGGPITGVFDGATALALQHWRDRGYRCPVVVEARRGDNFEILVSQNIWVRNAETNRRVRMFTSDMSRYYTIPERHRRFQDAQGDGSVVTGSYHPNGPQSLYPQHVLPEGELVPETLIGVPRAQLNANAALRSTYKVVRAVADQECEGFADSVNSYDQQVVSIGPCHWTYRVGAFAGANDVVTRGELPAFFSYLKSTEQDAATFDRVVGRFGVDVARPWGNDGSALDTGLQTYTDRFRLRYRTGDARTPTRTEFSPVLGRDRDYFRTWHWFHRFVTAGRFVDEYKRRMWHMARFRLRDIATVEIGPPVPTVGGAGGRAARVSDVISSELAICLLLRWHVFRPAHLINRGIARDAFEIARARAPAGVNLNQDPAAWPENDAYGEVLAGGLCERVPNNTFDTDDMNGRQARNGTLYESNPALPIQNRGAVLIEGGSRWEWRGAAATIAPLGAAPKRDLLLSLNRVINWPAGAKSAAENHPGAQTLYQTLGELSQTHGSFELS